MSKQNLILTFFIFLFVAGCVKNGSSAKNISFYYWKSKAVFSKSYAKAIKETKAKKIYLHYFDVESMYKGWYGDDGIFPSYVLKSVSKEYQKMDIVPVVYIMNNVFKTKNLDVISLSKRIGNLVNQISEKLFHRKIKRIQIDCDWTQNTRYSYFEFLKQLGKNFKINVTIRLHQIKYKKITGVPPVKKGTLLLYNIGDLKNKHQNSILESKIVKQYIDTKTQYPLPLNIALPLFSQTIVINNDNKIKIIRNTERTFLENDEHFKKVDKFNFVVTKDILYKGFFLTKGFDLKLEETKKAEIIKSYKIIKKSNLKIDEIIFYYLDEKTLSNINLNTIVKQL